MDPENIRNHKELKLHLSLLISEKEKRSGLIVGQVKEVYDVISHPAKIIKQTAKELAGDKDFRSDLILIAVNLASNFLARKVTSSAVSALLTLLVDKISARRNSSESGNIFSQLISMISGKKSGQKNNKESEL